MHRTPAGQGRQVLPALWALLAACAVLVLIGTQHPKAAPPQPAPAASATGPRASAALPDAADVSEAPAPTLPAAVPIRVRIPSIGVDAPLTGLSLEADGRLASPPPDQPALAGWYRDGAPPGTTGTAIIAGHVDTARGPAVFYALGALTAGSLILVDRDDGLTATFLADSVEVHDADAFPDERVYGAAVRPELRLITCGGGYDEKRRRYNGNVVVYAHLVE
ncbi:class F sortase [Streptomyces sp. NPDC098101]|uniref:class F sortase n=1 Tax=Streptomyces sp. NPDC098101 TaxID=3366096 RepID=UPI003824B7A8